MRSKSRLKITLSPAPEEGWIARMYAAILSRVPIIAANLSSPESQSDFIRDIKQRCPPDRLEMIEQ